MEIRRDREELNRRPPADAPVGVGAHRSLTTERLAQLIKELEFPLQDQRKVA